MRYKHILKASSNGDNNNGKRIGKCIRQQEGFEKNHRI